MMLLAIGAGVWTRASEGTRPATVILGAVAVFALVSYGFASTRHTGTMAPGDFALQLCMWHPKVRSSEWRRSLVRDFLAVAVPADAALAIRRAMGYEE